MLFVGIGFAKVLRTRSFLFFSSSVDFVVHSKRGGEAGGGGIVVGLSLCSMFLV